jgi:2-succinyl-5-enolpyruvyl-6-hydroxy-3-cyclohexene-1-carboxylate synthase
VHINLPLREPLAPVAEELSAEDWQGRDGGAPWARVGAPSSEPGDLAGLATRMAAATRGAIVAGPTTEDVAGPVTRLAARVGWPVLAEPASGLRCGSHDSGAVVAHYDVLLRSEDFAADHVPDVVLRLGDTPTSKPLRAWLAGTDQVVIDPHGAWHEPTRQAATLVQASPAAVCEGLASALEDSQADPGWLESWRAADALVPAALDEAPDPFEPKAYAALAGVLPEGAIVWSSSSMPVREVESFFPRSPKRLRFLSNRGANGIDGVVASAAGAALAAGAPTWVLIGEVALLHDVGGLLAARRAGADLTVVCVNNGGGGIFDFLPLPGHADPGLYEEHVATPTGLDLAKLAALADMDHRLVSTAEEVASASSSPGLVELRTSRADSVRLHRELYERVASRIG